MRRGAVLAGLAVLAACHRAPPAANQAEPANAVANLADSRRIPAPQSGVGSAALPAPELAGIATAPGGWRFHVSGDGAQAVFGAAGQPSAFALRCDAAARRMIFTRAGGDGDTLQIVAATGAATFAAQPDGHGRTRASDFVTDTFLTEVLAKAQGRIGVRIGAGPTLAMPADPAIGEVIRRCAAPRG